MANTVEIAVSVNADDAVGPINDLKSALVALQSQALLATRAMQQMDAS